MVSSQGFSLQEFLENVKATKPPYHCPYDDCDKVFKTVKGIHCHVVSHSKENMSNNENDDPITYVDPQKVVEFHFSGKPVQVSMYEPLALFTKEDFEEKYPELVKEPQEADEAPKTPSLKTSGTKSVGKKGSKTPKAGKNGIFGPSFL
ncbi:hypothetical protein QYM36_006163 [Artemia franciscana]|uniref:C2H2-type domain-containing protein n=1 Tax=Artemia franciscana TaxID=6661 RepID=A0AA88L6R9_ARTSF|nr:hypothetical protein QYM36_006163 [Artemia franciscana]